MKKGSPLNINKISPSVEKNKAKRSGLFSESDKSPTSNKSKEGIKKGFM